MLIYALVVLLKTIPNFRPKLPNIYTCFQTIWDGTYLHSFYRGVPPPPQPPHPPEKRAPNYYCVTWYILSGQAETRLSRIIINDNYTNNRHCSAVELTAQDKNSKPQLKMFNVFMSTNRNTGRLFLQQGVLELRFQELSGKLLQILYYISKTTIGIMSMSITTSALTRTCTECVIHHEKQ